MPLIALLYFFLVAFNIFDLKGDDSVIHQQQMDVDCFEQSNFAVSFDASLEDPLRDAFLEFLGYVELYNSVDKVGDYLDVFFQKFNANPYTRIRDFAGCRSYVSLFRLATHIARIDGQEGKFVVLKEMIKRGGNPFVVEEGERLSLIEENVLSYLQLSHPDKTGYLEVCNYEIASQEIKARLRLLHARLADNARKIQEIFEEADATRL